MYFDNDRSEKIARDLPGALEREEILAYFQPQFSLSTARIVSAEALARWEHPTLGMVSPAEFIPLAEDSGLIDELGQHMIGLACNTAADWQNAGFAVEVAVNVSLLQLRDPAFLSIFTEALAAASVDPRHIIAEITESTAARDVATATHTLGQLAATGVVVSVDDFGSGHSTIEQVDALPFGELKVDQLLVQDGDVETEARLEAAVEFGKSRHLRIVAEGVETAEQLARVRGLGCDRAQGYLLAHPMSQEALGTRLARVS